MKRMILTTRLTGVVTTEDMQRWKESLERDAAAIPDGGTFKLLLDLRGVTCTAFANVHHDAAKMQNYEERVGRANQRFFTDVDEARAWLETAV